MPIIYNSTVVNSATNGLSVRVNEYNQAEALFLTPAPAVTDRVKAKVANNVVQQLLSIMQGFTDSDPAWLGKANLVPAGGRSNYQALVNRRVLLTSLNAVKNVIDKLPDDAGLANKAALLGTLAGSINLQEKMIINRENLLNQTLANSVLEKIELCAAIAFTLGAATMGIGGALKAAGWFFKAAHTATVGSTMTGYGATTAGASLAFGVPSKIFQTQPSQRLVPIPELLAAPPTPAVSAAAFTPPPPARTCTLL